jgi:hypothetical protein
MDSHGTRSHVRTRGERVASKALSQTQRRHHHVWGRYFCCPTASRTTGLSAAFWTSGGNRPSLEHHPRRSRVYPYCGRHSPVYRSDCPKLNWALAPRDDYLVLLTHRPAPKDRWLRYQGVWTARKKRLAASVMLSPSTRSTPSLSTVGFVSWYQLLKDNDALVEP